MNFKEVLTLGQEILTKAEVDNPRLDARLLMQFVTGYALEKLLINYHQNIDLEQQILFQSFIQRRAAREPLAKIISKKGFWEDDFITSKDTLDPRPDSEVIIENCLQYFPDLTQKYKILDIGLGTGCLLFTLLKIYKISLGIGTDISFNTLKIAKQNMLNLGLSRRALITQQNWVEALANKFDIIVSNPPYIKTSDISTLAPEVKNFDPLLALDGGIDGLDCYRELSKKIKYLLNENGIAILEFGQNQENEITEIFTKENYLIKNIVKDLNGINRIIIVSLKNV